MLSELTDELIAKWRDERLASGPLHDVLRRFHVVLRDSDDREVERAAARLAPLLLGMPFTRVGPFGHFLGQLVGGRQLPAELISAAMLKLLHDLLRQSHHFLQLVLARVAEVRDSSSPLLRGDVLRDEIADSLMNEDPSDPLEFSGEPLDLLDEADFDVEGLERLAAEDDPSADPIEDLVTVAAVEYAAAQSPREHAAWEALKSFWRGAAPVLSRSPAARSAAKEWLPLVESLVDFHEAGHWLYELLRVLDDEPFLAIEPTTMLGVAGGMSGVADNFQLEMLLMHSFPRTAMKPVRIDESALRVAMGVGPASLHQTIECQWNMYQWTAWRDEAMTAEGATDFESSDHWIWSEGAPADIDRWDGKRVILLGPPSYRRSWQCERMFEFLPARLRIDRELSVKEVTDLLERMSE